MRRIRPEGPSHVWERFVSVRAGHEPNPSPPEAGLRMARLWDAIRASAAGSGAAVAIPADLEATAA